MRIKSVFAIMVVVVAGLSFQCREAGLEPDIGQLSLTTKYSNLPVLKAAGSSQDVIPPDAVDSIRITRARFVLKHITFRSATDSLAFAPEPIIMDCNLDGGMSEITSDLVRFGAFNGLEVGIHRLDDVDQRFFSSNERALFADFLAGERYSVIIDGICYRNDGTMTDFSYRSKIDLDRIFGLLPPLVIAPDTPVANMTFEVGSPGWFMGADGALLNPADAKNEQRIDLNLRSSFQVYHDNNRDGEKD